MARKPKAARSNELAAAVEEDLPGLDDTPAPARRGRKAKAAAILAEPLAAMDGDDALSGGFDTDNDVADPAEPPMLGRLGRKPKQSGDAPTAALLQKGPKAKRNGKARAPEAVPEPIPAEDDLLAAATAGHHEEAGGHDAAPLDATPDTAVPAQPAAHWNRATDTVQFDWAAIERTASHEGPNQAMAKLLVAARAEGANSRWPL